MFEVYRSAVEPPDVGHVVLGVVPGLTEEERRLVHHHVLVARHTLPLYALCKQRQVTLLTLSPPNLKMLFGTTFTFNIILLFISYKFVKGFLAITFLLRVISS